VELSPALRRLLDTAAEARTHAYCPYSGYAVGAGVHLVNGEVAAGCNVENISYGLSLCAERNAITASTLVGSDPPGIVAVAIVAGPLAESTIGSPKVLPCGACLQVIAEFAGPGCTIVCATPERLHEPTLFQLSELLPQRFGSG
jgi:cytidine deaminase